MMKKSGCLSCVTAIAVLWMLSAAAMAEPPIDTVTVEARRRRELLEQQISTFVTEIASHSKAESLARWTLPICPVVAGLTFEQGKFVFQRVSQVASEAGIPLAPVECKPNLVVVMTREPEKLLENWWDEQPRLFNSDRGVAPIKRKIRTPAPVRVFYNACSVPPSLAKTFGRHVLAHCNAGELGSRLTWNVIRAIYFVIVVVDKQKTEGVAIGPLTDYIAMMSLAHIRRDPDLGAAPTILRLFDETGAPAPQGLSAWDRLFLESLYKTNQGSVMQVSEIKERMKQDLAR